MVSWLHIISVGTSILVNYERYKASEAERLGVSGWGRASPMDPVQDVALSHASPSSMVFQSLMKFVEENPYRASAELNAFLKYTSLSSHAPPGEVGVLLYSSDTGTGYLCSRLVYEYLRRTGYRVLAEPLIITGLGRGPEKLDDALASLMDLVVSRIREWSGRGVKVYINATGGFKPETTFLVIASCIAGATAAYYIHEVFHEVTELPLPPLNLDPKLRELVKKTVSSPPASMREFREEAENLGLDPQELLERKLFKTTGTGAVKPRRWLQFITSNT